MPHRHHPADGNASNPAVLEDRRAADRRQTADLRSAGPADQRVQRRRAADRLNDPAVPVAAVSGQHSAHEWPGWSEDWPGEVRTAPNGEKSSGWYGPDRRIATAPPGDLPVRGERDLVEYALLAVLVGAFAIATIKSLDVAVFDGILRLQANLTSAL